MGSASGNAIEGLIAGDFVHQKSGVHFRVFKRDQRVWMSYERRSEPGFAGERELSYFVGSGRKGRSYLFSEQGFWFESPINWYSQEQQWNLAPTYTEATEIPMNLPAVLDCLNCHASGVQPPVAGTENKFSAQPFTHSGISCERCHGDSEAHLHGNGSILNPAKLPPERRDSICMECHFEGTVAIKQPERQLYQFEPGDRLSDYIHYLVLKGREPDGPEALSQVEAFSLSACKRKSGDGMSCLTCHNPHEEPAVSERAAYYRSKCLACHGEGFAAKHHPGEPDCTRCHMPSLQSADVAHTQSTDHRILRRPQTVELLQGESSIRLLPFPENEASLTTSRDFALGWENLAERGVEGASHEAEHYLRQALKDRPSDPALLSALGFVEQEHGRENEARELYERALKIDPLSNDAATNLGVLEARSGHPRQAIDLWKAAFDRVPHRSAVGMNLATVLCSLGQTGEARGYILRVLRFNPDLTPAKRALHELTPANSGCRT